MLTTYLYMLFILWSLSRPALNFTARSTLPIGAGLGSSASFSVCAATALLLIHKRISLPAPPKRTTEEHIHISHQGRRAIPAAVADEVNRWAFVAEKILHGNPSGVDNSVSVYGGALAYTRPGFERKSGMEVISGYECCPRRKLVLAHHFQVQIIPLPIDQFESTSRYKETSSRCWPEETRC